MANFSPPGRVPGQLNARLYGLWQAAPGQLGFDPDPQHDEQFLDVSPEWINFHGVERENRATLVGTAGGPYAAESWVVGGNDGETVRLAVPGTDRTITLHSPAPDEPGHGNLNAYFFYHGNTTASAQITYVKHSPYEFGKRTSITHEAIIRKSTSDGTAGRTSGAAPSGRSSAAEKGPSGASDHAMSAGMKMKSASTDERATKKATVLNPAFYGSWKAAANQVNYDPDPEHDEKFLDITEDWLDFSGPSTTDKSLTLHGGGGGPYPREKWKVVNPNCLRVTRPDHRTKETIELHLDVRRNRLVTLWDQNAHKSPVEIAYENCDPEKKLGDQHGIAAAVQDGCLVSMDKKQIQDAYNAKNSEIIKMRAEHRKKGREECCCPIFANVG
ncbi:unnamed protein product [Amoebophrya sp. A120]|nr:unnamed protein product [Amoebophrya sp. A120]|eukprot:GSA120T00004985001.1